MTGKKWVLISIAVIVLIALSLDSYYYYSNYKPLPPPPLKESSGYFAISALGGLYSTQHAIGINITKTGAMLLVAQFDFTFTPIGGPASNLRILINQVDPINTDWEGITIPNGTATDAAAHTNEGTITPNAALPVYRQTDGTFPLTIKMICDQATGNVILNFTATGPNQNLFPQ
jgi:hypothetical protein